MSRIVQSFPPEPVAYVLHAHLLDGTDWTAMATSPGRIAVELSACPEPCRGVTVHEWWLHGNHRSNFEWRKKSQYEWKV